MKRLIPILAITLVAAALLPSQSASAQKSPEAQLLSVWVGDWTYEDGSGSMSCEWFGDNTVQCDGSWTNDDGTTGEQLFVLRYDAQAEGYVGYRFYKGGYADSGHTWVDGDTWTMVFDSPRGNRYRATAVAAENTWSWDWHRSIHGSAWEAYGSGSMVRVK